jgi:diguanylate cyclase (GGDEF)-like protein
LDAVLGRGAQLVILGKRKRGETRLDPWLLERQLQEHFSNLTASAVGNIINTIIMLVVFWSSLSGFAIAVIAFSMAVLVTWRAILAHRLTKIVARARRLRRISESVVLSAAASGAFWGTAVGYLFIGAEMHQQVFLGLLSAGMMGAGATTFRTRKKAARLYIAANFPGFLFGFSSLPDNVSFAAIALMCCYVAFLFRSSAGAADGFAVSFQRERELARSNDTIRLLLNDYTEQGADCLIELNSAGALISPTQRLAELTRRPLETLDGKSLLSMLDLNDGASELGGHIKERRVFRNQIVSLSIDGEQFWWSINARPVSDGKFAFRGVISDITAQRQAEEQVSYMAHYDALTDLPNRFHFQQKLYHHMSRSGEVGIMYLDLDNFKAINDTLGHPVGDKLLQAVARLLEKCVTKSELIARLGGDEFAILVPKRRIGEIDKLAAKIVQTLSLPLSLGENDVVIGTSIGIAISPEHGSDVDTLVRNADLALYASKSLGRNRATRFESGMDEAAQSRRMIELDLRGALGKGEMNLHYQPLINIETGETTGYEALLRWQHPERGIVMPDSFIPVAEETGLIVQLGEWVIRTAISDLALWPAPLSVAINLSPAQMRSPTLISTLIHALATEQADPARICMEITESVLMQDSEANIETLHKLRDIGVQIALDDFGTGYSSLNYLRSFPFTKIKIDRCFVNELEEREDCQAIIRSVVGLATSLGMTTTAEGVESENQMTLLRLEGCTEAQGFLFSKAVPIEELSDLRQPKSRVDNILVQLAGESRIKQGSPTPARHAA